MTENIRDKGAASQCANWDKSVQGNVKLYHATSNLDLKMLEPRACRAVNGEEGSFIFAAEDYTGAHAYALKTDDMLCIHYMPGFPDKSVHVCIIKDREKFLNQNMTGTIHELPAEQFRRIFFESGEASYEWVSETPVVLDEKKATKVTLESAMAKGIQVFFAKPDADKSLVREVYDQDWANKSWEESSYYKAWKHGDLIWENHERGMSPFAHSAPTSNGLV